MFLREFITKSQKISLFVLCHKINVKLNSNKHPLFFDKRTEDVYCIWIPDDGMLAESDIVAVIYPHPCDSNTGLNWNATQ